MRLVNGAVAESVAADDRGLSYGDGLFETIAVLAGRPQRLPAHFARLAHGAERLRIPLPPRALLETELAAVCDGLETGVARVALTRGRGPRGYRPPAEAQPTRIVGADALAGVLARAPRPLRAVLCATRLARNPQFAGLKHLNRLEQVMAAAELVDGRHDEGLMLSTDGRLIGATQGNLFLVRGARLCTPELRDCGVAGTMRAALIAIAEAAGIAVEVGDLRIEQLQGADAAFVCNAVRGPRPLAGVEGLVQWPRPHPLCDHLRSLLGLPG
jgi:4-amino-4-deoxychorismate lyase